MARERFINKKFKAETQLLIDRINLIVAEYQAMGYVLSLRQAYYQCVTRNWVENTEQSYKNVGSAVTDGRLAGLIDWDAIEDRGRKLKKNTHWGSPAEIVNICAEQYAIDKWSPQPNFVLVMVEKEALAGVLQPACSKVDVRFAANKGYGSASFFYEVGKLLNRMDTRGKKLHVLYLGDHDPSGIDMTRDVRERLELLSRCNVNVHRLALNYDQVEEHQPPPNPTKISDSRAAAYINRFGYESWELDALRPDLLASLVTEFVVGLRDQDLWENAEQREFEERRQLQQVAKGFEAGTLNLNDVDDDEE